jgi:hypothetical protein
MVESSSDKSWGRTKRSLRLVATAFVLVCPFMLDACGGGSGSSSHRAPDSTFDPGTSLTLETHFPPSGSALDGVAATTVSGQLEDTADGRLQATDIMDLEVNGIKPSLDLTTGRWSARVPVDEGEQITLQAVVIDRNGDEQSATVQVSNVALPPFFSEIDVSLDSQFLYAYGNETLSIHDLVSGSKQLVSDGLLELSKPGFEPMLSVEGMEVSEDGTRAILLRRGWGGGDALSIDLETGDQETIGELPNANHARDGYDFAYRYPDMSADFDSDELAFSYRADVYNDDANRCWLGLLDLGSGSIRYILQAYDFSYDYSDDTYVPTFCPDQVVLETANNRVIVAAENRELFGFLKSDFQGIYAYDVYDGQLNTLSDATVGQGPDLSKANYLLPMQTENKLLTLNSSAVISVDLASGDRGLIVDDPDLPLQFNDAVLDESANRILIAEDVTVSALDLATGTREIVLNPGSSPSPAVGIVDFPRFRRHLHSS